MNEDSKLSSAERRFPADPKGFLFAPVLWFVWFVAIYSIQGAGCAVGLDDVNVLGISALRAVLAALTVVAAAALAAFGRKAFAAWRRLRDISNDAGGRPVDHAEFLAYGAVLNAALFLLAVIWAGLPIALSGLCHPAGL